MQESNAHLAQRRTSDGLVQAPLHAPQRIEGESLSAYRSRRAASHKEAARILRGTTLSPLGYAALGNPPGRTDKRRALAKAKRPAPTQPKFDKPRVHKQHKHPLRDEHGAYTLVGRTEILDVNEDGSFRDSFPGPRRKWLGGISAQRGY